MEDQPIEYAVRQGEDGKWRIDTAQLKGDVLHHGTLPEVYDDEAVAQTVADALNF